MTLREMTQRDEGNILELNSDPDVMRYLTNGTPSTIDEVKSTLRQIEELLRKHHGRFGFWAAHERKSNQFLGWFHFRPGKVDPENVKKIELGYRFLKRFWGHGYATEGSIALVRKGFTELDVEEVFAITMKKNLASRKVMEKTGLKLIREFFDSDFPGTDEKDVEYAISKTSWLIRD